MKKSFLFAAAAVIVAASCTKNGTIETPDPLDDGTPVAVEFSASAPKNIEVKSTGSVQTNWDSNVLKIYSYETGVTDFAAATPFINNVEAAAPATGNRGTISVLNPENNEPFYYVAGKYYDFYGYHIDDAATAEPTVNTDGVYVPFTITGAQDLMIAKADQATDIEAAGQTGTVLPERAYSAYAARRGVHPSLIFRHQLARFTFEIVAGSEAGSNINVDGISIFSAASGELKVAGENRGLTNLSTEQVELKLQENGTNGSQELTPTQPNAYTEERNNPKSVGESLMVLPGESEYRMLVYTSQAGVSTAIDPQEWTLNINNVTGGVEGATSFEAGYSYKVTIIVYGLEQVEITAELEDWKDGGSTVLDPDQF